MMVNVAKQATTEFMFSSWVIWVESRAESKYVLLRPLVQIKHAAIKYGLKVQARE